MLVKRKACVYTFGYLFMLLKVAIFNIYSMYKPNQVFVLIVVITGSQFTHFQVVVKALLINALDTSFLKSLYGMVFLLFFSLPEMELAMLSRHLRRMDAVFLSLSLSSITGTLANCGNL